MAFLDRIKKWGVTLGLASTVSLASGCKKEETQAPGMSQMEEIKTTVEVAQISRDRTSHTITPPPSLSVPKFTPPVATPKATLDSQAPTLETRMGLSEVLSPEAPKPKAKRFLPPPRPKVPSVSSFSPRSYQGPIDTFGTIDLDLEDIEEIKPVKTPPIFKAKAKGPKDKVVAATPQSTEEEELEEEDIIFMDDLPEVSSQVTQSDQPSSRLAANQWELSDNDTGITDAELDDLFEDSTTKGEGMIKSDAHIVRTNSGVNQNKALESEEAIRQEEVEDLFNQPENDSPVIVGATVMIPPFLPPELDPRPQVVAVPAQENKENNHSYLLAQLASIGLGINGSRLRRKREKEIEEESLMNQNIIDDMREARAMIRSAQGLGESIEGHEASEATMELIGELEAQSRAERPKTSADLIKERIAEQKTAIQVYPENGIMGNSQSNEPDAARATRRKANTLPHRSSTSLRLSESSVSLPQPLKEGGVKAEVKKDEIKRSLEVPVIEPKPEVKNPEVERYETEISQELEAARVNLDLAKNRLREAEEALSQFDLTNNNAWDSLLEALETKTTPKEGRKELELNLNQARLALQQAKANYDLMVMQYMQVKSESSLTHGIIAEFAPSSKKVAKKSPEIAANDPSTKAIAEVAGIRIVSDANIA